MKKSLLFALCLGLATITAAAQRNYSQVAEISLHFEWQKQLIGLVLQLNPNIQIIMTTHSPAVVMDGWTDRVTYSDDSYRALQNPVCSDIHYKNACHRLSLLWS